MLRRRLSDHVPARHVAIDETQALVPIPNLGAPGCELTVGRTASNALVLDHPELPLLISRKHATICPLHGGRVAVTDHAATNGTWINERRLEPLDTVILEARDLVSFGGPGCIMREGAPIRNPFMYEFLPEQAAEDMLDSPDHMHVQVAPRDEPMRSPEGGRSRLARVTRGAVQVEEPEIDSPLPELPRIRVQEQQQAHNSNDSGILERVLFHNPADDTGSPISDAGRASGTSTPRVRDRDSHLADQDANPSPSKKFKKRQPLASTAALRTRNENSPARAVDPKSRQALENQLECGICQDLMVGSHSLVPCGHMFCGMCLYNLQRHCPSGPACPHCRAKIEAPPVKCLAVDNILGDVVERLLDPDALDERDARRSKWERAQPRAAQAWANCFDLGARAREIGRMAQGENPQNVQLNSMLENLRQVRETLRGVTNPDSQQGAQQQRRSVGARETTHVVEYARSNRANCAGCHDLILAGSLRVGQQVQERHGAGVPYLSTRWFHFPCFSPQDWAAVDVSTMHGIRSLEPRGQMEVQAALQASRARRMMA